MHTDIPQSPTVKNGMFLWSPSRDIRGPIYSCKIIVYRWDVYSWLSVHYICVRLTYYDPNYVIEIKQGKTTTHLLGFTIRPMEQLLVVGVRHIGRLELVYMEQNLRRNVILLELDHQYLDIARFYLYMRIYLTIESYCNSSIFSACLRTITNINPYQILDYAFEFNQADKRRSCTSYVPHTEIHPAFSTKKKSYNLITTINLWYFFVRFFMHLTLLILRISTSIANPAQTLDSFFLL